MSCAAFSLTGRVALVTGANTGIGQAIAIALAEAGAEIVAVGRTLPTETQAAVLALGRPFHAVHADLGRTEVVSAVVDAALAHSGQIDILVNNAGIIRRCDAVDFSEADWDEVMDVNLKSAFFLTQAVGRRMIAARRGKVINIASLLSFQDRRIDAIAGERMGRQRHQCQRHRAGIFRHQQHPESSVGRGPQSRYPGPHPSRALGPAIGRRRRCGVSGGERVGLRERRHHSGGRWLDGPLTLTASSDTRVSFGLKQ